MNGSCEVVADAIVVMGSAHLGVRSGGCSGGSGGDGVRTSGGGGGGCSGGSGGDGVRTSGGGGGGCSGGSGGDGVRTSGGASEGCSSGSGGGGGDNDDYLLDTYVYVDRIILFIFIR